LLRSPDLNNPLDYFLWGHLKSLVYIPPIENENDLRNRTITSCEAIRLERHAVIFVPLTRQPALRHLPTGTSFIFAYAVYHEQEEESASVLTRPGGRIPLIGQAPPSGTH
ncbi:hypothetical protein ALC56_13291, partial [Trachymyrmex septentrionalis]